MRFLKEDYYGQSTELNQFVTQSKYRFNTYYKVAIFDKNSKPQLQDEYFAFKDSAYEYYNKLLDDINKYKWEDTTVTLDEITVKSEEENLEEFKLTEIEDDE